MRLRDVAAIGVVAVLLGACPTRATAQETRADTAAVLVQAARRLAAAGERDVAATLLRYVIYWYGDTPSAQQATRVLAATDRARAAGGGRTAFVITNTLFGGWLGVAIPAAFGSEDPPAYGAGLIIGPGVGLLGSLAYTKSYPITSGQAAAYRWSLIWGSWQGFVIQSLTGIGDTESCYSDGFGGTYCDSYTSSKTHFASLILGGGAGIAAGLVLTRLDLPPGDVAVVQDASVWGTLYGAALSVLVSADGNPTENEVYGWMAAAGNGLLLGAIPLARAWRPSVGRIRLITLGGLAGGLVGLGVDLLAEVDDDKVAVAIPTIGSLVGIGTAIALTARRDLAKAPASSQSDALLRLGRDAGVGAIAPEPRSIPLLRRDGSIGRAPVLGLRLLEIGF